MKASAGPDAQTFVAGRDVPTFVVIGAAGDGKSSIVKALTTSESKPTCGRAGGGVTKFISEYPIRGFDGQDWSLVDTMGVGDHDEGVAQLMAGLKHVLQQGRQIDGLVVTTLLASSRLGTAAQILREIIRHGMVKNSAGISPWARVIVVGTQRDRCDEEEIAAFADTARLFFRNCGVEPSPCQLVTTTTKGEGGMSALLESMGALGRAATQWDPEFESNGGLDRMSAGVATVTGGSKTLIKLEMEMACAWSEVLTDRLIGDAAEAVGQAGGGTATAFTTSYATDAIAMSVGKEAVQQFATKEAATTGIGSWLMQGSGLAIQEGSELTVGRALMDAAKGGGKAVINTRAGNVAVEVGTRMSVAQGVSAGASLGAGVAGIGAELLAGSFEATQEHKKKIGFSAQVGTAAAIGACSGPVGAAVGAGVGALSWAAGQVIGSVVENIIVDARGITNPKVRAWLEAKQRYETAKKEANEKLSAD